jgi:hypothetical protein
MTLILSCITRDAIVQVSDRCLTDLRSGTPVDQEANKAVFLSNRVAFAYTGLARIEGKPADIWLRDILIPHKSIRHGIQLVVDEATRAFAAMPGSLAAKRQAFVAAGWAQFDHLGSDLHPFGLTISNAIDQNGQWLAGAQPAFTGNGKILHGPRWGFSWTHAGELPRDRGIYVQRALRRMVERGVSLAAIANLFIKETRFMAKQPRSRVGRGLMVNSIPSAATKTNDLLALSSLPTETEMTFAHLRHDDSIQTTEGPHVVRPGGRVFSNFRQTLDDDGTETISVDLRAA